MASVWPFFVTDLQNAEIWERCLFVCPDEPLFAWHSEDLESLDDLLCAGACGRFKYSDALIRSNSGDSRDGVLAAYG